MSSLVSMWYTSSKHLNVIVILGLRQKDSFSQAKLLKCEGFVSSLWEGKRDKVLRVSAWEALTNPEKERDPTTKRSNDRVYSALFGSL